jgi:sirohydrochlorin cobaltochelatase
MNPSVPKLPHATLVLAAHAASGGAARHEPVWRWARMLGRRDLFASVRVGYVKGSPGLADAASDGATAAETVYVVPFFMADGWFNRRRIPAVLAGVRDSARLRLCAPVGTSPRLAIAADRLAAGTCRRLGLAPADTSLLLIAHGTSRESTSSAAPRAIGDALAATGQFAAVATAFLDEPPSVGEATASLPGKAVAAIGLFAAEGGHGTGDAPRLAQAAAAARRLPFTYAGVIGNAPGMAGAIIERVLAADAADQRPAAEAAN